jgi:prepilin-type N-terminal cleavage/methylation domain-containing protein
MQKRAGFTLIEIMIVVLIISVLAVIGLGVNYRSTQLASRDGRRRTDVASYAKALELYANQNSGKYPTSASVSSLPGTCTSLGLSTFLQSCPSNPSGVSTDYKYQTNSSATDYCVWVNLERTTNCYKSCSNGSNIVYAYTSGTDCTPASIP